MFALFLNLQHFNLMETLQFKVQTVKKNDQSGHLDMD